MNEEVCTRYMYEWMDDVIWYEDDVTHTHKHTHKQTMRTHKHTGTTQAYKHTYKYN